MKIFLSLVIVIILAGVGCHQPAGNEVNADGIVIKKTPLWKTAISDDGQLAPVVVATPITFGNMNVVVGATQNGQRSLAALSAQEGTKLWQWSDLLSLASNPSYKDPISIHKGTFYQNNGLLFFSYASSSYCIHLDGGTTQWKHKINLARFDLSAGIGSAFLSPAGTYGVGDDERVYRGDLRSSNLETALITPQYNPVDKPEPNGFGMIKGIIPFLSQADTLLAILFTDPNANIKNRSFSVSSLYNLSQRQWMYSRKVLNPALETGNIFYPALYNGRIYYASGLGIHCYDVLTGEPVWSVPFSAGFGFSGFVIADNKLIANCEDTYTYCLDPATGRQLWQEKSSGTSSPISYLNGVAYFLGGGDGKLHAIDTDTGHHLWKLDSPDLAHNSGAWFYGVCIAVAGSEGQKGRIVATTGLNACGFEAIR